MKSGLMTFAALLALAGCTTMEAATETERALCDAWGQSLPSRSRMDTEQTQGEIGQARAMWREVCG